MIGKFVECTPDSESCAEQAFGRALELNPRLSVAHKFYANLEGEMGQAQRALMRLLGEANHNGNDPELFAGLVHACRYCGLFEQAIAAHDEARRLDGAFGRIFGTWWDFMRYNKRLTWFTAGPTTVKSSRSIDPILP